jgi:hypothetical protein
MGHPVGNLLKMYQAYTVQHSKHLKRTKGDFIAEGSEFQDYRSSSCVEIRRRTLAESPHNSACIHEEISKCFTRLSLTVSLQSVDPLVQCPVISPSHASPLHARWLCIYHLLYRVVRRQPDVSEEHMTSIFSIRLSQVFACRFCWVLSCLLFSFNFVWWGETEFTCFLGH